MALRIGVIGSAGYTAGELLRILLRHPHVEITFAYSTSSAGKPVYAVHTDLYGETDLCFSGELRRDVDVVFLCLGHGKSREFLAENPWLLSKIIIDLSNDFRLAAPGHDFVYGLPELQRGAIQKARHIANPGCFATAIQLALLPLASATLLTDDIHISAVTGSTGAGQGLSESVHFSWRTSNVQIYKPFTHQHLPEIAQSLTSMQPDFSRELNFIPMRGNFTRGILASVYTKVPANEPELHRLYDEFYAPHLFTHRTRDNPDLKRVVNTNKCFLHIEKHGEYCLIVSVIDNLLKGASGQAVQNMNLISGFDEQCGLRLKAIGY